MPKKTPTYRCQRKTCIDLHGNHRNYKRVCVTTHFKINNLQLGKICAFNAGDIFYDADYRMCRFCAGLTYTPRNRVAVHRLLMQYRMIGPHDCFWIPAELAFDGRLTKADLNAFHMMQFKLLRGYTYEPTKADIIAYVNTMLDSKH